MRERRAGQPALRPVRAARSVTVAAEPARLWPFVADTDRIDRAAGLPSVSLAARSRPEGGEVVLGEYRVLGRPLARWVEHPFEWEWPRRFAVVREYQSGPLLRFYGGTELHPAPGGGTRLRSFVEITPRSRWLWPLIRFGLAPIGLRRAARQHLAIARFLAGRSETPFPGLLPSDARADAARLAERLGRLVAEGAPRAPTERLGRLVARGTDEDVAGMRPLELARQWALDGGETLEAFVRATVAGLLELRWELLCPRCRGVKASAVHLRELTASGRGFCPTCNLHFFASVDEAIEARFYPNPGVRRVELGTYCIGSPTRTPHRLAQAELMPGTRRTWELEVGPGQFQLFSPQSRGVAQLSVSAAEGAADGGRRTARVTFAADGPRPSELAVPAGRLGLHVENAAPFALTVALDDARWQATGATPGRLMTLSAFRELLSGEALAPGFELAIARVGLLFTDLAGSTALYERIGDARAFRLVGEHFTLLRRPIEDAGGAVVKTIGDAIMAAFADGRSAVAAGLAIQRAIRSLRADGVDDLSRLVKVGVHVGACYAVTLNDRLDYFGTAVNLAARAQHAAGGGEVVLTQAALDEGRPELERAGLQPVAFDVELKGFSDTVRLFRVDVARADG